jgi:23S rRNA (guanine2445-N2)-methyltransferase / 23S rRNA (guanine2069-N7)-methyltransferase
LYFSNNYRGFELDLEIEGTYEVEEITGDTIGLDYKRNHKIHRAWKIQHPVS